MTHSDADLAELHQQITDLRASIDTLGNLLSRQAQKLDVLLDHVTARGPSPAVLLDKPWLRKGFEPAND